MPDPPLILSSDDSAGDDSARDDSAGDDPAHDGSAGDGSHAPIHDAMRRHATIQQCSPSDWLTAPHPHRRSRHAQLSAQKYPPDFCGRG